MAREIEISDEFVQHDAFAENLADAHAILRGNAHQESERRIDPAEEHLEGHGIFYAEMRLRKADHVIRQRDDGDERDEHGDDVQRELKPVPGPATDRINGIGSRARHGGGRGGGGFADLGFGQHDFGDEQCGGTVQDGRGEQMSGGVLITRRHAHGRIDRRHTARDVSHAADHDGHKLTARHARDVRPDHQRRLGLAHENVRSGGECFTPARAHRLAHHPGDDMHDALQDSPMIKQRGQRGHNDDRAGDKDGENKTMFRPERLAKRFPARQRPEHELGSIRGKLDQLLDNLAGEFKHFRAPRRFQDQQRKGKLQANAPEDRAPGKVFPVVGDRPSHHEHREPAEQADQFEFHLFFADVLGNFLVNVRVQHADEREIAVTLGKIKPVSDDKMIGNLKAHVIGLDVFHAAGGLVEQHAGLDAARLERLELGNHAA